MNVSRGMSLFVAALAITMTVFSSAASATGYVREAKSITDIRSSVDYQSTDADTLRLYRAFLTGEPDLSGAVLDHPVACRGESR
ncbi:MAG: hypothetical protein R2706_03465 [Acidimicrobiales bacterium]